METIQFSTIIDQEQVIRPPSGITLPVGEIEVTVRPRERASVSTDDPLGPTRQWLLALAADAERAAPDHHFVQAGFRAMLLP